MQIEELTAGIASVSSEVAKFDGIAAGLAALEKAHPKDIACDVATTAGMKQAIAGRAAWRGPRIEVEKARKAAKAPVLELGRAIDTFAKELETKLLAGESHYDDQIKAEEARKEAEKAVKAEAERQRVAAIQGRIRSFSSAMYAATGQSPSTIEGIIKTISEELAPFDYDEFFDEAKAAQADALSKLADMLTAAIAQVAETNRLIAEREELARQRAEQEKRDAEARAAQAEADRIEREARAAEQAKLGAIAAEQRRAQETEVAARREAQEAAQRRLHNAAKLLLDALILAVPFVTDSATLAQCNEAIDAATERETIAALAA